ncbi:GntR family transcriptional regulator [Limosilactobacillus mucosae]
MQFEFDQTEPIYQQIADQLEDMIFTGLLKEGEQAPSTTQLSQELHINPATVLKGMRQLVDRGLLEKHRGLGMFVAAGAQAKIVETRKDAFYENYIKSLLEEAGKLGITEEHLIELIKRGYQDGSIKNQSPK